MLLKQIMYVLAWYTTKLWLDSLLIFTVLHHSLHPMWPPAFYKPHHNELIPFSLPYKDIRRIGHFKNQHHLQFLLLWRITVSHPDGDILPNHLCACTQPTCNHTHHQIPWESNAFPPTENTKHTREVFVTHWTPLTHPFHFFLPPEKNKISAITCTVQSLLTWHWKLRDE